MSTRLIATTLLALLLALPGRARRQTPSRFRRRERRKIWSMPCARRLASITHVPITQEAHLLEGTFASAKDARTLSSAPIFTGATLPVVVRFSDSTGIPDIPDTAGEANPRGFAMKIRATGADVDIVTISFNGFPVATSDEFAVFLRAIGASGPGVAHPTPIEEFLDRHPIAKHFVTSQKPPPPVWSPPAASLGVNAVKFTDASGRSAYMHYRLVPRGEHYLTRRSEGEGSRTIFWSSIIADGGLFDWYTRESRRRAARRTTRRSHGLRAESSCHSARSPSHEYPLTRRTLTDRRCFFQARHIQGSSPRIRC